ncbi:MAG: hypothetical protein K8W52_20855 [Deltaproteobacteria bacterium]|nr:hypothetical protein [Deltaproteobacteria bacterium]
MRSALLVLALALPACGDNASLVTTPDAAPIPSTWMEELAPATGLSVWTPEFEVDAGKEIQDCYFFTVPDLKQGADLWVDRLELGLNTGSHHLNLFRVNTVYGLDPAAGAPVDMNGVSGTVIHDGECWKSANWRDWPLVANDQNSPPGHPVLDWRLPTNVAQRFTPGEKLMLQIHYVNASTQTTPARARGGVNLHWSTDGDTEELGTLFATQQSIRICRSNPTPSYSGGCGLPAGAHTVVAANGHFHSRGQAFRIYGWDGLNTDPPADADMFYKSEHWAEPKMAIDLSVPLVDGGGIRWTCDYQWIEPEVGCAAVDAADPQHAGDCCYTFGPNVETNEHCNVFLYYYPKAARSDITCF